MSGGAIDKVLRAYGYHIGNTREGSAVGRSNIDAENFGVGCVASERVI